MWYRMDAPLLGTSYTSETLDSASCIEATCLMVAQYQHIACDYMVTFDNKAAKIEAAILLA
jgi:hypothetical protein